MDNVITISKKMPNHLQTYWIGVLVGMGYTCDIDPRCGLYRLLREHNADRYREVQAWKMWQKEHPDDSAAEYFISGIDRSAIKVQVVKFG